MLRTIDCRFRDGTNGLLNGGACRAFLIVGKMMNPLLLNNTITAFFANSSFCVGGTGVNGVVVPIVDR